MIRKLQHVIAQRDERGRALKMYGFTTEDSQHLIQPNIHNQEPPYLELKSFTDSINDTTPLSRARTA